MKPALQSIIAMLSQPGWRREKLQLLRWLMHDARPATSPVQAALEQALANADWEVRATAMLAAARLQVTTLTAPIARLVLPQASGQGVTDTEHRLLLALRDATLERLGVPRGRQLPPGVAQALTGDLSGLPLGLAMFVHALSVPLPDKVPATPEVAGVGWGAEGPRSSDGRWLAWVPPVMHWLGDDCLASGLPNPVRQHKPALGFFIDAQAHPPAPLAQAVDMAARLSARLGCTVTLASPDDWEMAARGPDGRRFPWGANAEPTARADLSPWSVAGIARGDGEWIASPDGQVAGGSHSPSPAKRRHADPAAAFGFRFAYG